MTLAEDNARDIARGGGARRLRVLLDGLEAGVPLNEFTAGTLQHMKIDLDGLSGAIEQHLQQVAPHEPQELA